MPDAESDSKSLKLQLLSAKHDVVSTLKSYHNFKSLQSDVVMLMNRLTILKDDYHLLFDSARNEVMPNLHSFKPNQTDRPLSAPDFQQMALAQLQEFVDMHSNCVYLLDLHQSLVRLESAVNQFGHCFDSLSHKSKLESWNDGVEEKQDLDDHDSENHRFVDRMNKPYQDSNDHVPFEDVDEETYRSCTNAVIMALQEVSEFYQQKPVMDKESVFVYQDLQKTWTRCTCILSHRVDQLWHRWIQIDTTSNSHINKRPTNLDDLSSAKLESFIADPSNFLFGLSDTLSIAELNQLLSAHPIEQPDQGQSDMGGDRQSGLMASLTILAKPTLISQLFRLCNTLKEIKVRANTLTTQIWQYLFIPWLERTPTTGNPKQQSWPEFKVRIMDKDHQDNMCKSSLPSPAWRLELWAPSVQLDENEEFLFQSCHQLVSVLRDLSTHLYGLSISCRRPNDDSDPVRLIDLSVDQNSSSWFDEDLAARLIDGRFAAGSACPELLNQVEFLAPVTQTVFHLINVAKDAGFLHDPVSESTADPNRSTQPPRGGASLLRSWLTNLPVLNRKRRENQIMGSVRQVMADRKLLFNLIEVGQTAQCKRSEPENEILRDVDDTDTVDGDLIEDLLVVPSSVTNESANFFTKADRSDLGRYLDLGHFDLPRCKISETIPTLLQQISNILRESETYLTKYEHDSTEQSPRTGLTDEQNNLVQSALAGSIFLVETLIELVPRILVIYTSLVPTLHADLADQDGRYAALYYNNCMYLAHTCLTLGERQLYPLAERVMEFHVRHQTSSEQWSDQLAILQRSAAASTCILVPQLRQAGLNCLLDYLRRERESLVNTLTKAKGFRDVSLPENLQRCKQSVYDCRTRLLSIAKDLTPLPKAIFARSVSILANAVCAELNHSVLASIDITRSDCEALLNLLSIITVTIPNIFECCDDTAERSNISNETSLIGNINRRIPEYPRLCGMVAVLSASSLTEIQDILWDSGNGPLVRDYDLKATELRKLVKAIYSSSSARDKLLKHLH